MTELIVSSGREDLSLRSRTDILVPLTAESGTKNPWDEADSTTRSRLRSLMCTLTEHGSTIVNAYRTATCVCGQSKRLMDWITWFMVITHKFRSWCDSEIHNLPYRISDHWLILFHAIHTSSSSSEWFHSCLCLHAWTKLTVLSPVRLQDYMPREL